MTEKFVLKSTVLRYIDEMLLTAEKKMQKKLSFRFSVSYMIVNSIYVGFLVLVGENKHFQNSGYVQSYTILPCILSTATVAVFRLW